MVRAMENMRWARRGEQSGRGVVTWKGVRHGFTHATSERRLEGGEGVSLTGIWAVAGGQGARECGRRHARMAGRLGRLGGGEKRERGRAECLGLWSP